MTKDKDRLKLFAENCAIGGMTIFAAAKYLHEHHFNDVSVTALRKRIERIWDGSVGKEWGTVYFKEPVVGTEVYIERVEDFENETKTDTNQYEEQPAMSALKANGQIMTVDEYCEHYGLPADFARTAKLVTHTGVPRYNIASNVLGAESDLMPIEEFKELIRSGIDCYRYVPPVNYNHNRQVIVVKISDLHFGAYIDNLIKTKKFSIGILADMLNESVRIINSQNSGEVHVHIHGDLIESFTGLNHKNSWKGLQKSMIGAEVVKLCTQVLHTEFLSKIDNLYTVKIVAGNHDRVTSNKDEDTDGDAANLIAWALGLLGYDVQFDPLVITHVVDGISYVCLHGDKSISKKDTKSICWDYGTPGIYNVVAEGHLHALKERSAKGRKEEVETTKDDAVDHIRMTLRSFFTGNSFSEYLGYTSNAGFSIMRNNGRGVPNIFHFAI